MIGHSLEAPSWSPDGSRIAYAQPGTVTYRSGGVKLTAHSIAIAHLHGTHHVRVRDGTDPDWQPRPPR